MIKTIDKYQVSLKLILKNGKGEMLGLKELSEGGHYDLPGGRIDTDEIDTDLERIIAREVGEELGTIDYKIKLFPVAIGRHRVIASRSATGAENRILYIFFEAEYLGGEITISREHRGFEWLDLKKIKLQEYFYSGMLDGLKMYLNR